MLSSFDNYSDAQKKIIEAYRKFVAKHKRHPVRADMGKLGFKRDTIRRHFVSMTELRATIKKLFPEDFIEVFDEDLFTPKKFQKLKSEVKKYKRFVITTAVNGCKVHLGFLNSIETYCKRNDAILLIIPSNDPAHNLDNKHGWNFDPILVSKLIVFDDLELNNNLHVSSILIGAKQIDPVTGLDRIGQRDGSFIYASPKQRMRVVPVGKGKLPHVLMTTGALTEADYTTDRFMSERTAYIAASDHILGAIIVELEDDEIFHFRQIQANSQGHFIDLSSCYQGTKITKVCPEAIVLGDWHTGETDPVAKSCWVEIIKELKPETIVLHDIFTARSISHHDNVKLLNKAKKAELGLLNLEQELRLVAEELNELAKLAPNVVIVKSNHDEHLERWLQEGRYQDEPHNMSLGLKLASAYIDGFDPLKWALENIIGLENKNKFRWLARDESFKISKIELGVHGDIGSGGSRGNIKNFETSYGACITGHTHTPQILRGAWIVGTSTYLDLEYNKGSSSWLQTSGLVYPNGSRQLINIIEGEWKLKNAD